MFRQSKTERIYNQQISRPAVQKARKNLQAEEGMSQIKSTAAGRNEKHLKG